jgi:hypothetical protein
VYVTFPNSIIRESSGRYSLSKILKNAFEPGIIPAFRRWRQEELEFQASLAYRVRSCLKKTKTKRNTFGLWM